MVRKGICFVINTFFAVLLICVIGVGVLWGLGIKPYIVLSGSMEPVIWTGSLVFVDEKYNYDDVKVGDVIAFKSGDVSVTHRVLNINENGEIETKGDNNDVSDGFSVSKDNFKGLSKFWIPKLGYMVNFLQSRRGTILGITGILSLLVIEWFFSSENEEEERSDNSNLSE